MSQEPRFDDLARAIATNQVSRSQMLKLAGGALLGSILGGFDVAVSAEEANAKKKRHGRNGKKRHGRNSKSNIYPGFCALDPSSLPQTTFANPLCKGCEKCQTLFNDIFGASKSGICAEHCPSDMPTCSEDKTKCCNDDETTCCKGHHQSCSTDEECCFAEINCVSGRCQWSPPPPQGSCKVDEDCPQKQGARRSECCNGVCCTNSQICDPINDADPPTLMCTDCAVANRGSLWTKSCYALNGDISCCAEGSVCCPGATGDKTRCPSSGPCPTVT